ncbi:galactosyltransferase-like protein [Orenia metallireducens]|jgi:cellulose synthase/poly-beta-1,6-N-acetylglucosamine synthase-like glycosyltransferase|uniref:N-terminal domain of galactosyltransferase n=1 Tax=Orenia metallireducens TaxID=1413210 RepID=A0A285GMQ5_9FIRM|nr:glycosyltransferase [Orenia metallireducens]PRX35693.1 galactosyltransferase-like protein [Orenia metallireducens]SNY24484.1 N-terminal domain of galactosyltransferase [Orenia metallireducens]
MINSSVDLSIIISIYKKNNYLELVLESLKQQTCKNFEVIIAEDNDEEELKKFIKQKRKIYNFNIKHVYQEDKGFRKSRILNEAIKKAESNFLIFIDSDCILHKKFLEEYTKRKSNNICLFSRRVLLDSKLTNVLLEEKNINYLSFMKILLSKSSHIEEGLYFPFDFNLIKRKTVMIGSNFGVSKDIIYKVNGFDEDYEDYGFEDTDLQWRLEKIGVEFKSLRNKAIQYHLFHGRNGQKEAFNKNKKIYKKKKEKGDVFCQNGLIKK